jgi:hypothetical protein
MWLVLHVGLNRERGPFLNFLTAQIILKGLSHEMNLAFDDMYMVSSWPKYGTRPVFKFFNC